MATLVKADNIEINAEQNQVCVFNGMTQSEFLRLAAIYRSSCSLLDGGLNGLICALIKILETVQLDVVIALCATLGINITPVLSLAANLIGTVNTVLGGTPVNGLLGGLGGLSIGADVVTSIGRGSGLLGGLFGGCC